MSAAEDKTLRIVLKRANAQAEAGELSARDASMAQLLYDRHDRVSAKELLCDERPYYELFAKSTVPCRVRTRWSANRTSSADGEGTGAQSASAKAADTLLRSLLTKANAEAAPGEEAAIAASLAQVLYDRHNHAAAKELLCEDRRYYDLFERSARPCRLRTHWSTDEVTASPVLKGEGAVDEGPVP